LFFPSSGGRPGGEEGVLAGVAVRGGVAAGSALLREAEDWQICGV